MKITLTQVNLVEALGVYLKSRGFSYDESKPLQVEFNVTRRPTSSIGATIDLGGAEAVACSDVGQASYADCDAAGAVLDLGQAEAIVGLQETAGEGEAPEKAVDPVVEAPAEVVTETAQVVVEGEAKAAGSLFG